jgi:tRNA(Ile2) C34 agmatinyltransferase TiaS
MFNKIYCPDCKVEMELIIPDDSENYYRCPKCNMEINQEDAEEE